MSPYLLNIAARSIGNNSNDLLPSTPVFNEADSGIIEDFAEENNMPVDTVQDQVIRPGSVPVQLNPLQNVQQAASSNRQETKEQEKNIEASYFSKYIERVTPGEENKPNKSSETIRFETGEPSSKPGVENREGKPGTYEPIYLDKTVSKVIPEKKGPKRQTSGKTSDKLSTTGQVDKTIPFKIQVTNPLTQNADQEIIKILPVNSRIERITPNQPGQQTKRPVQSNKMNAESPKLVIGKIIVEILPPKLPVPQKVITRVVQSSSKDSFPKSNKLSFGLGQL